MYIWTDMTRHNYMDLHNTADEKSPLVKCSKPGCKRFVNSFKYKRCNPCRTRQNALVKKSREHTSSAPSKVKKRALEATSPEEERPAQWARVHSSGPHISSEDEDEIPFCQDSENKVGYCFVKWSILNKHLSDSRGIYRCWKCTAQLTCTIQSKCIC